MFSASLSTVSAALHSLSGVIYNDYIRPQKWFAHTDANANLTMRLIIFMTGTFCAVAGVIVENFQSIFQVIGTVAGMSTGAVFGAFTLGMLWPFANKKVNNSISIGKIHLFFHFFLVFFFKTNECRVLYQV